MVAYIFDLMRLWVLITTAFVVSVLRNIEWDSPHSNCYNKYTKSINGAEISKHLLVFTLQPCAITYFYIGELTKCKCLCANIGATNKQHRRKTTVIAYTNSKSSGESGHLHSLARNFAVCSHIQ